MNKYFKWVGLSVILIFSSHMLLKIEAVWFSVFDFLVPLTKNSFQQDTAPPIQVFWFVLVTCMLICIVILCCVISNKTTFQQIGNKFISYLLVCFFSKQLFCFLYDGNKSVYYDYIDCAFIIATIALFFVKSKRWREKSSGIDIIVDDNVFYVVSERPKYFLPWLYSLATGYDMPHKKVVHNGMEFLYNWRFTFVCRIHRNLGGYVEQFNCDDGFSTYMHDNLVGKKGSYSDPCENAIGKVVRLYQPDVDELDDRSRLKYLYKNV